MGENVYADEIEIKIKRLHSATYSLPVGRNFFVLALKEQLAVVSTVISEQQHLLFRGRVLQNNRRLSDYHIENGNTLYMVVRRPVPQNANNNEEAGPSVRRERFFPSLNLALHIDHNVNTVMIEDVRTILTENQNEVRRRGNDPGRVAWIEQRRRLLHMGEMTQMLSNITGLIAEHHPIVPEIETTEQGTEAESALLMMNLGNSFIELGRALSRIANGDRLEYALLRAMPPIFPLPTGPLGTPPSNFGITMHIGVEFSWLPREGEEASDSTSIQQNNVQNASSPHLTDADSEEEARVNTVTRLDIYSKEEMVGVLVF